MIIMCKSPKNFHYWVLI